MDWPQFLAAVKEWGLPSALLALVLWSNYRQQQQAAARASDRERAADERQTTLITRLVQGDGNGGAGIQQVASKLGALASGQAAMGEQLAEHGKEIVSLSHRVCALEDTAEEHGAVLLTMTPKPPTRRKAATG